MTFRAKLFWVFTIALLLSVGVIVAGVTIVARRAFNDSNRQHSEALVSQFAGEFQRRGQDVVNRVQGIADAEGTVRMAIDLNRPKADVSVYVNDARGVSQSHQLDFLDFVATDGAIISSNEWPARFGYKMDWLTQTPDWRSVGTFLAKVDTQEGPALGLMAVSTVRVGDRDLYILGGQRLGKDFLNSLVLPAGWCRTATGWVRLSRRSGSSRSSGLSESCGRRILRARRSFTRCRCWAAINRCSAFC
jgi:two-component system, NtrC family, nitrogen regulation sensor histidine kinase NtrY